MLSWKSENHYVGGRCPLGEETGSHIGVFRVGTDINEIRNTKSFPSPLPLQSHLGPRPDGAPIRGGVFVLPRALSPAPFGQFR